MRLTLHSTLVPSSTYPSLSPQNDNGTHQIRFSFIFCNTESYGPRKYSTAASWNRQTVPLWLMKTLETLRRKLEELLKGKNPKTEEADDRVQQGRFPEGVRIERETPGVDILPTIQGKMEEVERHLASDEHSRIGICGKKGAGKTFLTRRIYEWMLECKYLDDVYRVSVGRECSVQQLQNDIAKEAGINIPDKGDEKRRATQLLQMLRWDMSGGKNTLFILDGMRDHFPLKKIGIPIGDNGCKVIVTSRSNDVCGKMACRPIIPLDPLPKEESLDAIHGGTWARGRT
ncbi:hypothetical protein Vadar_027432 [Vaccinium darrowii]|uniref:Uncharacterized protein n=1 Tax=Vaccinium darrowii TaxID=229202 RepID=A0ACB7XUD2_9ERIC|nr:hypothetical protein Vadar_027432 [Vaccinium darrowii]